MPHPQIHAHVQRVARRKQLKSDPALIAKITAEHIATARWFLTQYDVGNERRPKQAGILGTLYKRMNLALAKLAGYRCPEASELKRLLAIYKAQVDEVPLFISEDEIRSTTHSPADFWEEHCGRFIKAARSAYRKGNLTSADKANILNTIPKYRHMLGLFYGAANSGPPSIDDLHAALNALQLTLAPAQGTA